MDALAVVADVEGLWRPLSAPEEERATNLLGLASALVRSKVPTVDDRIADGTLDAELAKGVVVAMVVRVLQNPGGVRSKSVGSVSVTFDQVAPGLMLTEDEFALLAPGRKPRIGSARLAPGLACGG